MMEEQEETSIEENGTLNLSTNYEDYLKHEEKSPENDEYVNYKGEMAIATTDWNNRRQSEKNISFQEMALYLIVTDKDARFYKNDKFLFLDKTKQRKVMNLFEKYVLYYKKKSFTEMIEQQKFNLSLLDDEQITYDDIKDLDWNNKYEVKTSDIVNAFKNSFTDKNEVNKISDHVLTLDSNRMNTINTAFRKANFNKFEKELWKTHALEIFKHSGLGKLLDVGDVLLFIVEQYIRLYSTILKRGLPIKDTNAATQDKAFLNARTTMMDLLARIGKLKEARQVMMMTLDKKPDTLSSYLDREIKSLNEMLTDKFKNVTGTKATEICSSLKDLIKDTYNEKYNTAKAKIKSHPDYEKANDTELNRAVGFMLGLDIQMTLAEERKKKIDAQPKSAFTNKEGLGLAMQL